MESPHSPRRSPSAGRRAVTGVLVVQAASVVALSLAACSDLLAPRDVTGTYTLQTFRGHALPWADTSSADPQASGEITYGAQRTLRPDRVVVDIYRYATRTDARVRADTGATGRWVLDPPGLPADSPDVLRISYYIPGHPADYAHGISGAADRVVRGRLPGRRRRATPPSYESEFVSRRVGAPSARGGRPSYLTPHGAPTRPGMPGRAAPPRRAAYATYDGPTFRACWPNVSSTASPRAICCRSTSARRERIRSAPAGAVSHWPATKARCRPTRRCS